MIPPSAPAAARLPFALRHPGRLPTAIGARVARQSSAAPA